jgi:hypothetical protein
MDPMHRDEDDHSSNALSLTPYFLTLRLAITMSSPANAAAKLIKEQRGVRCSQVRCPAHTGGQGHSDARNNSALG